MSVIKILSAEVAGRIAAGEVIERPASVLKELVENSIDAGATRIRVLAEQGGQRLLQVIDNGCGMDRQDALLCLEAHATSKIRDESDVGQIHTLGFRGEALPSISSVSRFHLQTRQADVLEGTEILINYGQIEDVRDCGCAPGTNIKVAYIFGNLPARRKFLKGPATEDSHLEETMLLLALSRPDIAFDLHLNGRKVLQVGSAQDIAARTAMLLGKDAFLAMLPVDYVEERVHVYGYISKPGFTRSTRHEQRIIVNGRAAIADTVYFGIRNAYDTLIPKGRYPAVVLYIDLEPDRVDVNIHPTKHEVRFRDSMRISAILAAALRQALRSMPGGAEEITTPAIGSDSREKGASPEPLPVMPVPFVPAPVQPSLPLPGPFRQTHTGAPVFSPPTTPTSSQATPSPEALKTSNTPPTPPPPAEGAGANMLQTLRIKSRLGKRYLLAESSAGLVVVDLVAAQQRILFERLLKNLQASKIPQQQLLLPITVNLSPDESKFLHSELSHFQSLGFSLEHFGGHCFLVTALPANLPDQDFAVTIRDIIDDLRNNNLSNRQNAIHLAQVASRHAVRIREQWSEADLHCILRDLVRCEMPYACPAGHPTMVHITYSELEKRFKQ
ncbi:MAG: DNA mismatch repair endonuclease MutL [Lentisphaeria bacterium]